MAQTMQFTFGEFSATITMDDAAPQPTQEPKATQEAKPARQAKPRQVATAKTAKPTSDAKGLLARVRLATTEGRYDDALALCPEGWTQERTAIANKLAKTLPEAPTEAPKVKATKTRKATTTAKPTQPAAHPVLDNEPVRVPTLNKTPKVKAATVAKPSSPKPQGPGATKLDSWITALRGKVAILKRDGEAAAIIPAAQELRGLYIATQTAQTEAQADNDAEGVALLTRKLKAIAEAIDGLDKVVAKAAVATV